MAAFINAIGTKAEAIEWLQKTWDELCEVKVSLTQAQGRASLAQAQYYDVAHALGFLTIEIDPQLHDEVIAKAHRLRRAQTSEEDQAGLMSRMLNAAAGEE